VAAALSPLRASALGLLALAVHGCVPLDGRMVEETFYSKYVELSFERRADLIAPERLRVTSTADRQIGLSWDPVLVGDVAGYAILRSREPASGFEVIGRTMSRFQTVYVDVGTGPELLGDEQTYHYRVHPYDAMGQVSRSHASISASTDRRPEPPSGLRAYSNLPRKVALAWDPSRNPSVAGYAVYRSPSPSGEWVQVGFAKGRLNTVWEDDVAGDLRVMYYRVEALNNFNGSSDPSTPVQAVTKAEPLPPISLGASAETLGSVELGWAPNVEPDLRGYQIFRALEDPDGELGSEQSLGEVQADATAFVDANVGCGQRMRYRLRAIDRDGLVSGFSEALMVTSQNLGLDVGNGAAGPELRWDRARASRWPAARIAELRSALPDKELGTVAGEARFSLSGLSPGTHRLRVTLTATDPATGAAGAIPDAPACTAQIDIREDGSAVAVVPPLRPEPDTTARKPAPAAP
jgi:fibronectin type 3 domain-containing protein